MAKRFITIITVAILSLATYANGQCKIDINAFQGGEILTYDLYFKYGFYMKAGYSTLHITSTRYNKKDAYKMMLIGKSSGTARKLFSLDDTLSCYTTKKLEPLAFEKNAHEGSNYTNETLTYSYANGTTTVNAKRTKNGEFRFDETQTTTGCIYDMMSVVYYARTLDYSTMKRGDAVNVEFMTGRNKANMEIKHDGIEKVNANDDKSYSCIKLVLSIYNANDKTFSDKKEAMKVYITDDDNRMPVRLDSKLKVGSTKAILKSYKGNKFPVKTM